LNTTPGALNGNSAAATPGASSSSAAAVVGPHRVPRPWQRSLAHARHAATADTSTGAPACVDCAGQLCACPSSAKFSQAADAHHSPDDSPSGMVITRLKIPSSYGDPSGPLMKASHTNLQRGREVRTCRSSVDARMAVSRHERGRWTGSTAMTAPAPAAVRANDN